MLSPDLILILILIRSAERGAQRAPILIPIPWPAFQEAAREPAAMAMNKAVDVHVHGSAGGPGMEPEESGGHGLRGPDQEAEDGWGVPNVEAR